MENKSKKVLMALNPLSRSTSSRLSLPKGESKKVLIALSGGIDSAVSAYLLLKKGYYVEAVFMKNWSSTQGLVINQCPWLEDRRHSLRAAAFLGLKLHTLDFEKEYQKKVMKYFFDEYKKGRTPNPDVMCNKEIKFKLLYEWAMRRKFDYLATGHYARIGPRAKGVGLRKKYLALSPKPYTLLRSKDEFKDQTYFIYNIKANQLPHLLFPIGGMKKSAVRSLARKIGLPNAERKESMGLCFVGKIRLKDFLKQKLKAKKGEIVFSPVLSSRTLSRDPESKNWIPDTPPGRGSGMTDRIIGHHYGLHNYTIGQRQGINVGAGGPYFVFGKDLKHNRLYVTNDPEDDRLLVKEVQIHSVNFISPPNPLFFKEGESRNSPLRIRGDRGVIFYGRYRHQGELVPLTINQIDKNHYRVIFNKPQKAVASGQSLVLYKGKECVGGGVIG